MEMVLFGGKQLRIDILETKVIIQNNWTRLDSNRKIPIWKDKKIIMMWKPPDSCQTASSLQLQPRLREAQEGLIELCYIALWWLKHVHTAWVLQATFSYISFHTLEHIKNTDHSKIKQCYVSLHYAVEGPFWMTHNLTRKGPRLYEVQWSINLSLSKHSLHPSTST